MVRIPHPDALNSYILKIRFKRWGKLWTVGNTLLYEMDKARSLERRDRWIGTGIQFVPLSHLRVKLTQKRYQYKMAATPQLTNSQRPPNCFLLDCYNPEKQVIKLSLTMRSLDGEQKIAFQRLLDLSPGFSRHKVPFVDISKVLDTKSPFGIDMIPNDVPDGTTLYFGFMDFVFDSSFQPAQSKLCKCVVWDLDNTLWNGILAEEGPDRLCLKPGMADILKELDRRGILLSIASKNDPGEALSVLRHFKVEEYFLCPQISWNPKGGALRRIARTLNIGMDSLLFVDDNEFERAQVKAACPEVEVLDAKEYVSLLDRSECQPVVTEESRKRRQLYREQEIREVAEERFEGDCFAFLRDCHIQLRIRPMAKDTLERVHELTQRTNQMNFSGNRYDRKQLEQILTSEHLNTYVLDCEDRFGSYGTVGFSVIDKREPRMKDLMFSCRIQAKRVEHAFLTYVIRKYVSATGSDFYVSYRETPRNGQPGKVFHDFGFEKLGENDGTLDLVFRKDYELPDDKLIQLVVQDDH